MGTFDEIFCDAALPDDRACSGTRFQTKSFPEPCLFQYRITKAGRLVDSLGFDLQVEGYISFYRMDDEDDEREPLQGNRGSINYRAKFVLGQLQDILRVEEEAENGVYYGLAFFRRFNPAASVPGDPVASTNDRSPIDPPDEERGNLMFSVTQASGAKITWPDVDLDD